MLCAELEALEAQLDEVITALEAPGLSPARKQSLEKSYAALVQRMEQHERTGHRGKPCYETAEVEVD